MKSARVRQTGASMLHDAMASQKRLPVSGKIRAGIKVLTNAALKMPKLRQIYQDGIDRERPFDDIERAMRDVPNCPKHPLIPSNAPYFRVLPGDFTDPAAAASIMNAFAETRPGDPFSRLYSFPILFPSDDLDLIFHEQFESWKATELFRWSEPGPDGELQCMRRAEIPATKSKRRVWGGRPIESLGPCDPNNCAIFAAGNCSHTGSLYFWIPGLIGAGLIELQFKSLYASMGIVEILEFVQAGLGHIKGTHHGKPIFRLSKTLESVSRIDWEKGKAQRTDQWIIRLDANLDMARIAAQQERALLGAPVDIPDFPEPAALPKPMDTKPSESEKTNEPEPTEDADHDRDQIADLRAQLSDLVKTMEWTAKDLREWIEANYESTDAAHDPETLADMITKLYPMAHPEIPDPAEPEPDADPNDDADLDKEPF